MFINKNTVRNNTENIRKFCKPFVILFILSFIVINWSEIDWLFNYKFFASALGGITDNFSAEAREKIPSPAASPSGDFSAELPTTEIIKDLPEVSAERKQDEDSLTGSRIEIPKIGVIAPVMLSEGESQEDFLAALKKGALYFPDSVLPGDKGALLILGHSAPPNWPKINYDWIFNDLYLLEQGDFIYLDTSHKRYTYKVSEKLFVNKKEGVPDYILRSEKSYIVLISCWPPGKDAKRIIIAAELIN